MLLPPMNFKAWLEDNRDQLKPPVGNVQLYKDSEFIVMVVGGPNARTDYHIDAGEELFYMVEGDMTLKVVDDGVMKDIVIREGEMFRLPPNVPHSPQRTENSVGIVIERVRRDGELDGLRWYCPDCEIPIWETFFELVDIETQFPPVFADFYADPEKHTCSQCGHVVRDPKAS